MESNKGKFLKKYIPTKYIFENCYDPNKVQWVKNNNNNNAYVILNSYTFKPTAIQI